MMGGVSLVRTWSKFEWLDKVDDDARQWLRLQDINRTISAF